MKNKELYHSFFRKAPLQKVALRFRNEITYMELLDNIESATTLFLQKGIGEGDIVAIQINNSFTLIHLVFATWKCNATVLLLDPALKEYEINTRLITAKANYFVFESQKISYVFTGFIESVKFDIRQIDIQKGSENGALMLCSSGTTGSPKLVRRNSCSVWEEMRRHSSFENALNSSDEVLLLSPMYHSFGLLSGMLNTLYNSASCNFSSNTAGAIVSALQVKNITVIFGVPFHYKLMLSKTKECKIANLRIVISAGEMLDPTVYDLFSRKFGVKIGQLYGMSELGLISVDLTGAYQGSVGRVADDVRVKLVNDEIQVHLPSSTYVIENQYKDDWLRTFDRGEFIGDILYIKGRVDSLFIRGGKKIDLLEIEILVLSYKTVFESLVVANDQEIICYICVDSVFVFSEFIHWLTTKLSNHKIPNKVVIVEKFNRTNTNKIIRKNLDELNVLIEHQIL